MKEQAHEVKCTMSGQQPNSQIASVSPIKPWLLAPCFIGRPDLFFATIANQPLLWSAFLATVAVSVAIPRHLPMLLMINVDSVINLWMQGFCTFVFLLLENAVFALMAHLLSKGLGAKSAYKAMFIACSFAQLPYVLLNTLIPELLHFQISSVIYLTLAWSFVLSISAIRAVTNVAWLKALAITLAIFAVALPLMVIGAPYSGRLICSALQEQEHSRNLAAAADSDLPPEFNQTQSVNTSDSNLHPAAPNVTLHTADGKTVQLSALRGKVVVLDFWSTWCGPCRKALPLMAELYESTKDKGAIFFAVNTSETKEVAEPYLQKNQLTNLNLCLDRDQSNATAFKVFSIPYVVIIDKNGLIHSIHEGYSPKDRAALALEVDAALTKP